MLLAAGETARSASAFQRRLILAAIVDELSAAGELAALGAVVDTPGLVVALDRAIAEIKRAAIEPDDLDRAVGTGNVRDRRTDLAVIYRHYQQALAARELYDVEGQAWLTREHLRAAPANAPLPGLAGIRAIVADGFTDFTPTQLEILAAASARLQRVVITLPHATDGRARMWHWTGRTLANIREKFGDRLAEITPQVPTAGTRSLAESVFDIDATCDLPKGLAVIAAAGMESEVAAVARRVKRLLVDGTPAGRIAVLARSLDAYGTTVRRVFADHEIPLAPAAEPLTEIPIVRFAVNVASLSPELAWNDVLHVIRSSYFRPAALGAFDERTVAAAEKLIREGNVQSGRDAYADAAQRLAARAERAAARRDPDDSDSDDEASPHEPSADEYRQASEMLAALFDLSERAASHRGLSEVAAALDLPNAACDLDRPEAIARDLRALATLEDHLARLPDPPPPAEHVLRALTAVSCPPSRGESLVDVLDVLDARAIRYDHVFVLGVSERMFPHPQAENPLVGEADRSAWRGRGLRLDSRRDLTAREMLLFYLAITRAEQTLTLSYLEADSGGQVGSPSGFLLALADAVGGLSTIPTERIAPGPYFPSGERIASRRDAIAAGVAGLLGSELPPEPRTLAWSAAVAPNAVGRAAMGIWAAHQRWTPGECSEFDGRITDPALQAELRARFGREPIFSAAQLDTFGQCPWQYFAKYVLHLAPQVEPQRRLEPTARGSFCHNVLFRLMRSLAADSAGPIRLAEIPAETVADELDKAIAAESAAVEARRPPYPVLWQIQLDQMRRDLTEYLRAAADPNALPSRAKRFELSFGSELDPDEPHDPRSTPEPVSVTTPAGDIRIRGRVDRVDDVNFDDVSGLLVVDYKTGRVPNEGDVLAGRNLQMPLYAAAVEALLGEPCVGGAFHRIGGSGRFERFFAAVTTARGKNPYKVDDGYQAKLQAALETVGRFVGQMAAGRFDALPTHDCPSYCPFRQMCQFSPVRASGRPRARRPGPSRGGPLMPSDAQLTDPQRAAAIDTARENVALRSGAGCGKTFVLARRFLTLLQRGRPGRATDEAAEDVLSRFVALTFTNKAALEMSTRVRSMLDERAARPPATTAPACSPGWSRCPRPASAPSTGSARPCCEPTPSRPASTPASACAPMSFSPADWSPTQPSGPCSPPWSRSVRTLAACWATWASTPSSTSSNSS